VAFTVLAAKVETSEYTIQNKQQQLTTSKQIQGHNPVIFPLVRKRHALQYLCNFLTNFTAIYLIS